jgi:ABC-type multidrug transport system permease subunit
VIRGTRLIAVQELRRVMRDRWSLLWMVLLPVVFAAFTGVVVGGPSGGPRDARSDVVVVDRDGGAVARLLVDELASERLVVREITPEEADAPSDVVRDRTLVLPAGLTEAVLRGEATPLTLEVGPQANSEKVLLAQARIFAAIARVLGTLVALEEARDGERDIDADVLAAYERPDDLVIVEARFAGESRVVPSGFTQSIPGNIVMFVMLIALTYGAESISTERRGGQLRRLVTTPLSRGEILGGKLGGRVLIAWVQITLLTLVGWAAQRFLGVPLGDDLLSVWGVLLVYALAVAPLGLLFGAAFRDPERASSLGVIATLLMAALGGCWWPIEVVSPTLQKVALLFPTGWAMNALHDVISFGRSFTEVAPELGVLLAYGVVFAVAGAKLLRVE